MVTMLESQSTELSSLHEIMVVKPHVQLEPRGFLEGFFEGVPHGVPRLQELGPESIVNLIIINNKIPVLFPNDCINI